MSFDSLVRTKQLNKPELSGYIVDVFLKYLKTGAVTGIATNTGLLTGEFYPLKENPSGYINTGSLSGYATIAYVNASDTSLLSYIENTYYPANNPSGFITSGIFSGISEATGDFNIVGVGGITVTGIDNIIYISGEGQSALTGYVPWNYFDESQALSFEYIKVHNLYGYPGSFYCGGEHFVLGGYWPTQPSEPIIIDLYGTFHEPLGIQSNRPFIKGFDIYAAVLQSSGYNVLTVKDSTGYVTMVQLLTTSGLLSDEDQRIRTEMQEISGGVTNINVTGRLLSGSVGFSGIGGTVITTSGNTVLISGGGGGFVETGNFVTTGQTGQFASSGRLNATGAFLQSEIKIISGTTGAFITNSQTGAFASVVNLNATGAFLQSEIKIISGTTGAFITSGQLKGLNTGSFITTGQTGQFATSGNLNATGAFLQSEIRIISGTTGAFITSGLLQGLNTGSFVTTGMTGQFAPELIGLPIDGIYGGTNGAIAGIAEGDRHEDAFDKIEVILGKLAPSKPLYLSQATFGLTGSTYSAFMQGTSTQYTSVQATLRPTGYATGFWDGDNGILSGFINGVATGSRTLTTGNDTGNFSGLRIYADFDFWSGVAGRAGFWSALSTSLAPSGNSFVNTGLFTMQLRHSTAGNTAVLTAYADNPTAPASLALTNVAASTGACALRTIDGIPCLANGDKVVVRYTGAGAISAFYANPIGRITSSVASNSTVMATLNPVNGQSYALSGIQTMNNTVYSSGIQFTAILYNSASGSNSSVLSSNIRVDTVSSQQAQRKTAGSGQFPAGGYGTGYDNNAVFSGNEELQMINGIIQYPPKVNYGSFIPFGPNYSNIPSGSNSGHRWAFFDFGTMTNVQNIQVHFNSPSNFGASQIVPNFQLYVKVSGAIGWIDGNQVYPSVGNPSANGAPALVLSSGTASDKLITFGTTTLTGPVYIRVGLPSGSTKSFGTVTCSPA